MICLLTISVSLVLAVSTPSMVVEPVLMGGRGVLGMDMATSALNWLGGVGSAAENDKESAAGYPTIILYTTATPQPYSNSTTKQISATHTQIMNSI